MNRREFLKISVLVTASLFLPGCLRKSDAEVESIDIPGIRLINNWIYPVLFETERFYAVSDNFGLSFPSRKSVDIIITNETQAYETEHEIQSHLVIVSDQETVDEIRISGGRYVDAVKRWTGEEPHTVQDELFLSMSLSESIINGLADLAHLRGDMSETEANDIADLYADSLMTQEDILSLIFARVSLTDSQSQEVQA